jgi:hypothetical protein
VPEGRKNAYRAILLEMVSLVVAYGNSVDEKLRERAFNYLGR